MKKLVSLLLVLVLALSLSSAALAYDAANPITIKFWHTRGSGANGETCTLQTQMFNETVGKELGIIVEETYIGNYDTLFAQFSLSTQAGEQPAVVVSGNTYVVNLIDDGLLEDMMPYAERDGFDVANILDCFMDIAGNTDGELYSLPYVRSTPVMYYNKSMADAKGVTVPQVVTWDEMAEIAKAMVVKEDNGEVTTYGVEIFNDNGYYAAAWLNQLGEPMLSAEGDLETRTSPALEGTSWLTVMDNWAKGVDEGWIRAFDATSASTVATQMMYEGKLFGILNSCGSMKNIVKNMADAGYELGVAQFPTYDAARPVSEVGGGQICLVKKGNSEEIINAGWEYLKFLMSDEQQFINSTGSGYLPCTKSVATYDQMVEFWAANPTFKVPFDQLDNAVCQEYPAYINLQEFILNWKEITDLVIGNRSLSAAEGLEQMKANVSMFMD